MGAVTSTQWVAAQAHEIEYWRRPGVEAHEAAKQRQYAQHMGIRLPAMHGKRILDIGGGPVSLLLQCDGLGSESVVLDPMPLTVMAATRYGERGIHYVRCAAEDWRLGESFDEAWIYNVLQHVRDPNAVLATAKDTARVIHIFEWLNMPTDAMHLHILTEATLAPHFDFYRVGEARNDLLDGRFFVGVWLW